MSTTTSDRIIAFMRKNAPAQTGVIEQAGHQEDLRLIDSSSFLGSIPYYERGMLVRCTRLRAARIEGVQVFLLVTREGCAQWEYNQHHTGALALALHMARVGFARALPEELVLVN